MYFIDQSSMEQRNYETPCIILIGCEIYKFVNDVYFAPSFYGLAPFDCNQALDALTRPNIKNYIIYKQRGINPIRHEVGQGIITRGLQNISRLSFNCFFTQINYYISHDLPCITNHALHIKICNFSLGSNSSLLIDVFRQLLCFHKCFSILCTLKLNMVSC